MMAIASLEGIQLVEGMPRSCCKLDLTEFLITGKLPLHPGFAIVEKFQKVREGGSIERSQSDAGGWKGFY
jgi:hypothetical protein